MTIRDFFINKARLPLLLLIIFLHVGLSHAVDASQRLLIPFEQLKGINRISLFVGLGPSAEVVLSSPKRNPALPVATVVTEAAEASLRSILESRPNIQIANASTDKNAILYVEVQISARQVTDPSGRATKVAALTAKLTNSKTVMQFPTISYPFLVTGNDDDLRRNVGEGVRYLLAFVPNYITCANQATNNPPCDLKYNYGEKK